MLVCKCKQLLYQCAGPSWVTWRSLA